VVGGIREYARHRGALGLTGTTHGAVQKAIQRGRIQQLSDGRIDFEAADCLWAGTACPVPGEAAGKRLAEVPDPVKRRESRGALPLPENRLVAATIRLQEAKAEREESRAKRESGDLLPREDVAKAMQLLSRKHGAAMEAGPTQWAVLVAGKTDLGEIEIILRREVNKLRESFADEIEQLWPNVELSEEHVVTKD